MKLEDIFEVDFSVRKTVWSKRGEKITRRDVDSVAGNDIQPRNKIEIKNAAIE